MLPKLDGGQVGAADAAKDGAESDPFLGGQFGYGHVAEFETGNGGNEGAAIEEAGAFDEHPAKGSDFEEYGLQVISADQGPANSGLWFGCGAGQTIAEPERWSTDSSAAASIPTGSRHGRYNR